MEPVWRFTFLNRNVCTILFTVACWKDTDEGGHPQVIWVYIKRDVLDLENAYEIEPTDVVHTLLECNTVADVLSIFGWRGETLRHWIWDSQAIQQDWHDVMLGDLLMTRMEYSPSAVLWVET